MCSSVLIYSKTEGHNSVTHSLSLSLCVCVCDCFSFPLAQLDSLILVELVFVIATSASQADAIVTAVDDLIHKHLIPEKSNVK